ncbi:MAG TPA: MoaD/ThiS family protein [Dehalococcoidales bacterium]|nr:MoaD/ThiS family protein [Dehalococcoidales bacterium]
MDVFIELFGLPKEIIKSERISLPLTGGMVVRDAFSYLKNRYPAVPLEQAPFLVTVNSEIASMDSLLKAGDTVCFLPHIGGG